MILEILLSVLLQSVHSDIIATNDGPLVETNVGSIRGVRADDGDYNMFMGIPYATVNESNIFGTSIPHPRFEGIFEANNDSALCPQIGEFDFVTTGSLDCLHLNIYVPHTATFRNLLPVMVYIHGSSFLTGFAGRFVHGPQYLVRHDVILVTINYRLGPFGFMCLHTPEIPGNQGLKDQVTALRWVRDNIHAFNGDSNKITLFGNSAGAISIGYHMISETEKLYTNAILQSGSAFYSFGEPNLSLPQQIAAALGHPTNDMNEALEYLSTVHVHLIIEASSGLPNGPCIEKEFPGVERFMSEYAINSNHSKVEGVPILHGYNDKEMLAVFANPGSAEVWKGWSLMFSSNLRSYFNFSETMLQELEAIVKRFYVGDEDINDDVREEMTFFLGDYVVYPIIRSMSTFLKANSGNIYQYLFSYDGGRNLVKVKDDITAPGAAHADEGGYLFHVDFIPEEPSPEDWVIIDRMTVMWTNFAKYGDPTPETTLLLPVKWEPITKGSPYHYLEINTEMSAKKRYAPQRMSFWDLFYKAYRDYEWTYTGQDKDAEDIEEEEEGGVPDSASLAYFCPMLITLSMLTSILH